MTWTKGARAISLKALASLSSLCFRETERWEALLYHILELCHFLITGPRAMTMAAHTLITATVNFAEVFCFWSCFLGYPVAMTEELDNSTTSEDERPCDWRIFSTCSIAFHLKAALYSSLCIFIGVILSCPPSMSYLGWWPEITGCPPPL